jgi:hypothetical protein
MVLEQEKPFAEQDRRTAGAELVLEGAEWMFPNGFAIKVVADQALAAKEDVDALPITSRARAGWTAGGVVKRLQAGGRSFPLPQDPTVSRRQSDGGQRPVVRPVSGDKESVRGDHWGRVTALQRGSPAPHALGPQPAGQPLGLGQTKIGAEVN